jgi:hypothetical protein
MVKNKKLSKEEAFNRIKELVIKWNDNEIDNVTAIVDITRIVSRVP